MRGATFIARVDAFGSAAESLFEGSASRLASSAASGRTTEQTVAHGGAAPRKLSIAGHTSSGRST
jgi:hypothetical protein